MSTAVPALIRKGMAAFELNQVEASILAFDEAATLAPERRPYLWQRGLSLFYADQFEAAAAQFRLDVAVNPNDTEEAIWALLCEARTHEDGFSGAQSKMLLVGHDSRPVMRTAYALFRGKGSLEEMRAAGGKMAHDRFYSLLYEGLYLEARAFNGSRTVETGDEGRTAILAATQSEYGTTSGDYMTFLAKVHAIRRGWVSPQIKANEL